MIAILSEAIGAIGRTARTAAAVRRFAWHLTGLAPGRRLRLRQPLRETPLAGWEKQGGAGTGRKRCCLAGIAAALITAVAVALADAARADEGTWVQVGANFGEGRYTSLAFDPANNQPWVAYGDSTKNGYLTVKRFDGANWVTVGAAGMSDGWPGYTSLAFDPASGQPYVAYGGGGTPGFKLTVKRFDGTSWVTVGTPVGTYSTGGGVLAFDPASNQPYVAYTDSVYGGIEAKVIRFDGRDWAQVGPPAGKTQGYLVLSIGEIDLAFHPATHEPYVAYQEADGAKATVKRFDGANWVPVGAPGFSGSEVDDISLAFDPTHEPVVAYHDHGPRGFGPFQVLLKRFDGTNWVQVGPATGERADYVTLAFHPASGQPYLAYEDQSNFNAATVKRFDGTDWVSVGEPGFTTQSAVGLTLVFDLAAGQPFVAVDYWSPSVWKFEAAALPPQAPQIVRAETFREGVMVFFRVFFTDPNDDATEFGFRGVLGSGWAEETHPFSAPSYGRVFPGRVEYPFNHGCGTGSEYESDVEVWIGDSAGLQSPPVTVHLACSAPSGAPVTTRAMRGKARQWQTHSLQVK